MAAIDPFRLDAILGDKAQPSDVFGLNRVLGKPREPEGLGSALSRGFVEAAQQVPQLLGGLQAGAGAALESAFGEGGIGTAIKESGLERYKKWEDKIQAGSRESDSWDYSWEQATENGDRGALAKWIAHGIGYTGGQGLQMLLGAGVGTIAGKAALGKVAQTVANGMVRREAGQIAAATAAKELGETATKEAIAAKAAELALLPELQKEAVKAAAGTIGRNAVIGASAFGQEAGEIFGDLTQKAQEEGRTLTGSELGRAFWSSVAAGGLEFVGDKLSLNVMLGKSRVLKGAQYAEGLGGRAARAALGSVAIAPAEAATEYFQTGLEEYGKGTEQNIIPAFQSEAGQKQAREAAMLGGLGGLVMGGAGGALHGPRPRPTARDILASTSVDDAIGTFVDSLGQSNAPMAGKPLTGRELRAANAGVLDYVRALDPGEQAEALRLLADVQNPNLPAGPKRFAQDRLGELFASVHKIPVGEVEEVSQIPAGEATEVMRDAIAADRAMDEFRSKYAEQLPIGEATDVVPEEVSPAPPAENRTPRVSTAAKELDFSGTTAMVKTFVDRMAAIGTPAARAFVSDYRAGRISDDDVFRAMSASEWVSPDQRISEASEALARAAAKRAPSAQPSDLLAPGDVPYRTKLSAMLRAKHEGLDNSTVVPAPDGGFVVRPREGVGHDAQGDQQGAGGTDVPRHIDAGRGGSADRGGIGIAGRGDTGVVEREGIHGGGTTDVGAVGAEQLTSQAASEATHAPAEAPSSGSGSAVPVGAGPEGVPGALSGGSQFDPQGLKPGTPEYEAAFTSWSDKRAQAKAAGESARQRGENQTAIDKRNAWRKRVRDWFLAAKDGDTITDTGTGTKYRVVVKKRANGQTIKSLVAVDDSGQPLSDGRAATGIGMVDDRVDGLDDASLDQDTGSTTPETAGASLAASLGQLLESGEAATSGPTPAPSLKDRVDAKLTDLKAERTRIEQVVADAYAKTAAGKPAATDDVPAPSAAPQEAADEDMRGYAWALVKDGKVVRSGSLPSPEFSHASDDTKLSYYKAMADKTGADLHIGGYPGAAAWAPQEGLIFGMTWGELSARQQKGGRAVSAPEGKMPKDAVLAYSPAVPAAVATHKDPGEPAEVVTPAVVADAIKTAAANTDRTRGEMKAEALRLIDAAIAKAPSTSEIDGNIIIRDPSTDRGRKVINAVRKFGGDDDTIQVKATSGSDGKWEVVDDSYDGSGTGRKRNTRLGGLVGTPAIARSQLMDLMRQLQPDGTLSEIDTVTIKVPGDGTFTVKNTVERLKEFRKQVEASPGFKDRQVRPAVEDAGDGAQRGSGGPKSAIQNMIDDGDAQAAVDYAAARGMNLADVLKGDKTRLDKVAGLTPTEAEAVGAFEPEAAEAKQGTTPPAEVGPEYTNAPDAATAQTANDVATGAATNARIENFGEALPPPRRALRRLEDVSEADIAHKPLSELWPQSVNDEIEDKRMAAVAHAMRSAIPSKPRQASKLTKWAKSVAILRAWMQALLRGEVQIEPLMDRLREVALARGLVSKIAVLENVDRSQWKRIGNVAEYPQAFKYVDGKKIPAPHVMVEIDGKTRALEGSGSVADHLDEISALLGAKAEPVRMQFEVRGTEQRGFRINKKGDREYRALLTFKTAKDAFAALRDRHDELVQAWERIKERDNVTERDLRTSENRPRTGEDYRHGRDITSAEFEERFGFRGGEFGDWVTQGRGDKDRQALLNSAYDALMDLASILDVPPRAISLDGSLGIAFGSRGSGWASAHFEPNTLVINLTKPRGAGALAHEWFHALDNYFARLRNAGYEVKARSSSEYRDKNYVTHNPEPLMVRKDGTGRPLLRSTLQERKARNPTATYFDEDQWQPDPSHPQGVRPVVERRFAALVDALNAAPFTKRAAHIDSSSGYWSRRLERAARSFEVYIQSRMAQRGFQNDYLVNVTSLEDFKRDPGRYPYPTPEEIEPIAKAFDDLFATIETRETERGVALFSRASEDVRQDSNGARATAIRAAITKAYGGLLDALESRGLVTLTQTLDQAIALAARARSAATGRSVDESRRELMPDANRQTGGASMSDKTQIDPIYSRSGNVEGFHDPVTGKSFLVADNLTEMTAPGTLMHEVGVHMADAGVLEDMMRRGERLIREHSDEPMVRRAIKRMASAGETSPEEFVAYLVTEYENDRVNAPRSVRAFIRDLIAAIRAWLHKQGFVNTGSLTVADIAAIARANARSTASRRGGIGTRQEQGQDIRFSMAPAAQAVKDFTAALRGGSAKRFNALHRTIATQLHKASIDPDYGRVFAIGQEFERDIARATARAAALAPDVLPAFDNAKSAFWRVVHGAKGDEEVDKAGQALWAGTLENGPEADSGVVWSDEQLRERFGLGAEGSKLYRQARAAIDASLDETAAAIAFQLVKRNAGDLAGAIMEAPARARELIEERLGSEVTEAAQAYLADAKAMPNASEETKNVAAALKVLGRASALKAGGYAPLMRFGRYAVEVRDRDGTLVDFRKFDSELSAKMAEQRMRRQYPGASIERSVMSEDAWKLFAGVDPETVMLFADHIDGLDNDVKQQWYRAALSERSAMKHLIAPRKGMPGYSADLRRVLSSFIGSSARLAARQMHMGSMKAEISDMIDRKVSGDVIDEAQKLQEYLEAPDEPFKGTRSLMFTWYLGGSVASAAVNLTQPLMMTLPYLSQFGSAGKTMLGAIKESVSGKVNDATLAQALKRASDDGIVDPQTVHHLYHHGMKSLIDALPGGAGAKARAQGFSTLWGLMFGAAENFNRRITFISAYRMALADKTLGDPYAFAARAVEETQGIYSRGNRPNWARGTGAFGALGVAAFTFKQYSIAYVELLVRMAKAGPKGRLAAAAMLGMMALAAGMQGVPFAEDIEDLVDTVAQQLGYRGNTKASIREALIDAFGTGVADAMMYGASAGLPLDVSGRLGLGHLIPAIGIGKLTERDRRGKQLAELAGPIGGFYGSLMDAVEAAGAGKGGGEVIAAFAPIAVRNAMIGAQMAERGYYSDTRGRRVTDTDAGDAFIKALGFQPESVASVRRPQYLVAQDIARMRGVKQDISDLRARAIVEREPDLRVRAEEMLREWNTNNPDMRITINAADIMKRVTAARATSAERIKKTAPQQVRRRVAELLNAP